MRIAQVSPLFESVPPRLYGGTERIVSYLTEQLVKLGHEVTLFASGDSITSARLVAPCSQGLRLADRYIDPLSYHLLMLSQIAKLKDEFDVIHYHTDSLHFPMTRLLGVPAITTVHGRLDNPDIAPLYREFSDMPFVSISNAQRTPLPWLNWVATVHHGLPRDLLPFTPAPKDYVAFLGRFSPEKRPDRAIDMAIRAGLRIRMAAKIENADIRYFESVVKPLLSHPLVEYVGEIEEGGKARFLGDAMALLFPIDWPEPFGLVMIESLACGTPVIAFPHGSVPEIIRHGETGFLVDNVEEGIEALLRIEGIRRERCRTDFEERFTVERMTMDYIEIYEREIHREQDTVWRKRGRLDSRGRSGVRPGDLAAG